jgi:hypothetical protein
MKGILSGTASKFVVSVLGAVATSLSTYYSADHWSTIVIAAITALSVYLVPNSKPAAEEEHLMPPQ